MLLNSRPTNLDSIVFRFSRRAHPPVCFDMLLESTLTRKLEVVGCNF